MNDLSLSDISDPIEVEVLEAKEAWSEYRLVDGTTLRVKPIMIAVSRIGDAESAIGEPVYNMRSTLITDVREAKRPPQLG
jgi:hypothetical protein